MPQLVFLGDTLKEADILPPQMPEWRQWYLDHIAQHMPHYVDWRNVDGLNFVTDTQTQVVPYYWGSCSANAVSTALADRLTIQHYMVHRMMPLSPITVSTQVIFDCSKSQGDGQRGGNSYNGYAYVHEHGVPSESCSPYLARSLVAKGEQCSELEICKACPSDGSECKVPENFKKYYVDAFGKISGAQEMKLQIAAFGPISCQVYDPLAFDYFLLQSDIFRLNIDKVPFLNHVLEVVGWTQKDGVDVWIMRNSEGSAWGEYGYGYVPISDNEADNLAIQRSCSWGTPSISPEHQDLFLQHALLQ